MSLPNTKTSLSKKQRSLKGRLPILALKLAAIPVIAFILFYGVMTAWWYSGEVRINRDVVGELVARSAASGRPTPAWPNFLQALNKIDALERAITDIVHPRHSDWDRWMDSVQRQADQIALLRDTLNHESLGFLASTITQMGGEWVYENPGNPGITSSIDSSLDLIDSTGDLINQLSEAQALLTVDAWRAAEAGDPATATADLVTLFRIADQTRETSFLLSDMVAFGAYGKALNQTSWIIESHPSLFTASQLQVLRKANNKFMDGDIRVSLEDEHLFYHDEAQRIYTDNGSGNGHAVVYYPRFEMFDMPVWTGREFSFKGPLWLLVAPSRAEYETMSERCLDSVLSDQQASYRPIWQTETGLLADELEGSWLYEQRWKQHARSLPIMRRIAVVARHTQMRQEAASTLLSIIEFRLEQGDFPVSLDDLIPNYIDSVPADYYTGQPIHYQLTDDPGQFTLYSSGPDQQDNGGPPEDPDGVNWSRDYEGDVIFWPIAPPVHRDYGF